MCLEEKIISLAKEKQLRIASVESVTGGRISSALTSVSGSSEVFYAGGVLYDTKAKEQFLDLPSDFFEEYSVYSHECAEELAKRWAKKCDADICISTTGESGPNGDHVGRVFFGLYCDGRIETFEKNFFGDREGIQNQATLFGLELILQKLEKGKENLSYLY